MLALTVDTISNGFALVTMVDIHRQKLAKIVLEGVVRRGLLGVSRQVFLWAVELWKGRSRNFALAAYRGYPFISLMPVIVNVTCMCAQVATFVCVIDSAWVELEVEAGV